MFKERWGPLENGLVPNSFKQVPLVFRNLKLISQRLPPKVHSAAVRFVFNGFHTAKRYQRTSPCLLCNETQTADSIEHIASCKKIRQCIPLGYYNMRDTNRLFFLLSSHEEHTITFAMFLYAIYSVHNEIRHTGITRELKLQIGRAMHGCTLQKRDRILWNSFIGWG